MVVIFMLMALALSVGIGVSSRFIKNLRSTKETDFSGRAVAIAEAGVESLLLESFETLDEYIQYGSCGSACTLEITGVDGVTARAQVSLSHLGASADAFPLNLTTTQTQEINLSGYPDDRDLWLCWDPPSGEEPSIVGLYFHGTSGNYGVDNFAYNSFGSSYSANGFSEASANFDYTNCFSISGKPNPKMVRLRSVYDDVSVFVVPDVGELLPTQGILIESVGTVVDVTKVVSVVKSATFLPTPFDYVLYSKSTQDALSNMPSD